MAEVVAPRSRRTESVPRPATSVPRSLMSRFSTGHVVMIVAGLLGLLLTVAVLRRADERQPVAVAARDLAPGTALTEASVRYERVRMDDSLLGTVLQPNDVKRLRDSVAAYPIAAGELVHRRAVRPAAAPAGKRAMSVALVFSTEAWVEGLHRHLTDHGGARVRQVIADPSLAFDEEYGTLVVSHRWPGLTRTFVEAVHRRGRCLLGVFDPEEPAGREFLASLGGDRVLSADAALAGVGDGFVALGPERHPAPPAVSAPEAAVDGRRLPATSAEG